MKGLELFDLSGRVAVVIGGTTGLGREIALGFAAAGADVVASSRRQQQVDAVAAEIEALGRRTLRITSDVLDRGFASAPARCGDREIRQSGHPGERGRPDQENAHA